jgi:urate oxidase
MELRDASWAESSVRLSKVTRRPGDDDIMDMTVSVRLAGGIDQVASDFDIAAALPAQAVSDTILVLAHEHEFEAPEDLALVISEHFLSHVQDLDHVRVGFERTMWRRMTVDGRLHPHAFVQRTAERHAGSVADDRNGPVVTAGVEGLGVLTTRMVAGPGTSDDERTSLDARTGRVMAATVGADWVYAGRPGDYMATWRGVRREITESFARSRDRRWSTPILYTMGAAVLERFPVVERITLRLRESRQRPVDLSRFGIDNADVVVQPVSEPHAMIEATVSR